VNGAPLYTGDLVRYTVVVTNHTALTLTDVAITDTLPGGVAFVKSTPGGYTGPNPLVWRSLDLAGMGRTRRAAEATFDIGPSVRWTGVITVRVTALGGEGIGGNLASVRGAPEGGGPVLTGTVGPIYPPTAPEGLVADGLVASKTAVDEDGGSLYVGDGVRYDLTVTNTSTTTALSDVVVSDTLPVSVTLVGGSVACSAGATCGGGGSVVTATQGLLAAEGVLTVTFRATANDVLTLTADPQWHFAPDPAAICNAAAVWAAEQGAQFPAACLDLVPRRIYLPLVTRNYGP
jgi:uncharacterized repeat protein (TIGR01451 family)